MKTKKIKLKKWNGIVIDKDGYVLFCDDKKKIHKSKFKVDSKNPFGLYC